MSTYSCAKNIHNFNFNLKCLAFIGIFQTANIIINMLSTSHVRISSKRKQNNFNILAVFVARSWRACHLAAPLKYRPLVTEGSKWIFCLIILSPPLVFCVNIT